MHWIAPLEADTAASTLEKRLWDAAAQFRANSGLKALEYSGNPSHGLFIHSVEKTGETGRLCRLNLAVHGLESNIRHGSQGSYYYGNLHNATGRCGCDGGLTARLTG